MGTATKPRPRLPPEYKYFPDDARERLALLADPNASPPLTFHQFVSTVKPEYRWYRYAEEIARALAQVADGWLKRLLIFAPPQLGKSELVSRIFPAYCLYRHPERWYGLTSYGAILAYGFSRSARNNYRLALGSRTTGGETEGVEQWETGKGGGLWTAGVGGAATGKPANGVIIDDPVKDPIEAASETTQQRNIEWFDQVIVPRTIPHNGFIVLVQTRWHQQDLAGKLLEREEGDSPEGWTVIDLAAIHEQGRPDAFPLSCDVVPDWRSVGESVCEERLPLKTLHTLRTRNPYVWNALYQQNPTPREGGMFHRTWFEIVPAPPPPNELAALARWWDIAATEAGGDYTAGVLMCRTRSGVYYVLDVVRGQWASGVRDARIRQTAALDGHKVRQLGPQDPGAAGKDMARAFTKLLDGYPVSVFTETGSKETRADPLASAAYTDDPLGGRVKLVRGEWNEALLAELAAFPYGTHDDQVDAASGVYNYLSRLKLQPLAKASGTHTIWTG